MARNFWQVTRSDAPPHARCWNPPAPTGHPKQTYLGDNVVLLAHGDLVHKGGGTALVAEGLGDFADLGLAAGCRWKKGGAWIEEGELAGAPWVEGVASGMGWVGMPLLHLPTVPQTSKGGMRSSQCRKQSEMVHSPDTRGAAAARRATATTKAVARMMKYQAGAVGCGVCGVCMEGDG